MRKPTMIARLLKIITTTLVKTFIPKPYHFQHKKARKKVEFNPWMWYDKAMVLGALKSRVDLRDLKLGKVQSPVSIPLSYKTDISWLEPLWQDGFPMCGSHSGSHLKEILDYPELKTPLKYSPIYLWKKIKSIDGNSPEAGTDMRSIFKTLLNKGVCDYELLPTDYTKTLLEHTKNDTTSIQGENAQPRVISSYAFVSTDVESLKQAIFQNKVVLVRIIVGDTFWGWSSVRLPVRKDGGHFVVFYGYDKDYFYALDSADKEVPLKRLVINYPVEECGVAVDLPNEIVRQQIQRLAWLQQLVELFRQVIALMKLK